MHASIADKVSQFFASFPVKHYTKGQVLVHAGDEPTGVFYLISGQVRQYDISGGGEQIIVNIFKPQAFFPMSWAINKTPNQYFFEAATDIEFRLAPADLVVEFLQSNPDITFDLLARVYSGTDGLLRRMAHLMGGNARSRLLFELLIATRRFGVQNMDGTCLVEISESELANRAGLSRETISREMGTLKNLVHVSRQGILVRDLASLEKELGNEL